MDDGTWEAAPAREALNPLEVTGQVLVVASALMIIAGVLYAYAFDSGWRGRLEIISGYGASIVTAILVLGAMVALLGARTERIRPFAVAAQIMAGLIVLLAIAASISVLTQSFDNSFAGPVGQNEWATKLATVFPHLAAIIVSAIVLLLASRSADA